MFAGTLSAERHWVIDEHRLGTGEALLPGTGYIELVRAALAEIGHAGRGSSATSSSRIRCSSRTVRRAITAFVCAATSAGGMSACSRVAPARRRPKAGRNARAPR